MKRIYQNWLCGWAYFFGDELISFYVFFTSIFASCAWLYVYCELSTAILLTIVMLGYIANTMIFSWLKGNAEGTRRELVFSICYLVGFITIFLIGLIINWKIHLVMMSIIVAVTGIAVWLREKNVFAGLQYTMFYMLFILLTLWTAKIPGLPVVLKIIIPVVYVMCIPFISYYEDSAAAQNIFELAYDNTWSPEYEKRIRELDSKDKVV